MIRNLIERAHQNGIENTKIFSGIFKYCFDRNLNAVEARRTLCDALSLSDDTIRGFEKAKTMNEMLEVFSTI